MLYNYVEYILYLVKPLCWAATVITIDPFQQFDGKSMATVTEENVDNQSHILQFSLWKLATKVAKKNPAITHQFEEAVCCCFCQYFVASRGSPQFLYGSGIIVQILALFHEMIFVVLYTMELLCDDEDCRNKQVLVSWRVVLNHFGLFHLWHTWRTLWPGLLCFSTHLINTNSFFLNLARFS